MTVVISITIFMFLFCGLFLPRLPQGYETEWEPSIFNKWLNRKKGNK